MRWTSRALWRQIGRNRLSAILLLASFGPSLPATQFVVQTWRIEDGLPESTVTSLVQGSAGYLWAGTRKGLVRFDGVKFQTFEAPDVPGLDSDAIQQITGDPVGGLWCGTVDGLLFRFDRNRAWTWVRPEPNQVPEEIRHLSQSRDGAVWIQYGSGRLVRFQQNQGTDVSMGWNLRGDRAESLTTDESGDIWISTKIELARWDGDRFEVVWTASEPARGGIELGPARGGGVWESRNRHLRRWDGRQWSRRLHWTWTDAPAQSLREDGDGRLWVGTLGQGLYGFETNGIVHHLGKKDGLASDLVRHLHVDHEGNLWVATHRGGLTRIRPASIAVFGRQEGLSSDTVESVSEGPDGTLWIGTNDRGITGLSRDGTISVMGQAQGLLPRQVHAVHCDGQGTLWAGTWGRGLFRKDGARFVAVQDRRYLGDVIQGFWEDDSGRLWILQRFGPAHVAWVEQGQVGGFDLPGVTERLAVKALARDPSGALWIGTWNQGLWRFKDETASRFGTAEGLGSDRVLSLWANPNGAVWVGTEGGGLSCIADGRVRTWNKNQGLISNSIEWMSPDDLGSLWLASHHGVGRVYPEELLQSADRSDDPIICTRYGTADGMRSIRCGPNGCVTRSGRICIGTDTGLAMFDPAFMKAQPPPGVVVEKVVMDGKDVYLTGQPGNTDERARADSTIEVGAGVNRLEVHFTALSFTAPDQIQFRYRLLGLDEKWVQAGSQRQAVYTSLPPGRYTLEIKASNGQGNWSRAATVLGLSVAPYFWQSRWFLFLGGGVMAAGLASGVRYAERRRLKRQLDRLERARALESERARIAQDLHDDLGTRLTEIGLLGSLASRPGAPAAQARSQAEQITGLAASSVSALDEIVWALNPANDSVQSLVHYCCQYGRHFLENASLRCDLDVARDLPDHPLTSEQRHHLFLAFKESLNNVVRHASATSVTIVVAAQKEMLLVQVRDDGRGVLSGPLDSGSDGLRNMTRRLELLGGRCDMVSSPGAGTTITLRFPVR